MAQGKREPRRVYVVIDVETKEVVACGTNRKNLVEDFPIEEGHVVRSYFSEAAMRPGGRS